MAKYGIADYLTTEEKIKMTGQVYKPTYRLRETSCVGDSTWDYPTAVDENGACPLGVIYPFSPTPNSGEFINWLIEEGRLRPWAEDLVRVTNAWGLVHSFVKDWDQGKINDLRAALGVDDQV